VVRRVSEVKIGIYNVLFLSQLHLNYNFSQKMMVILGLLK
jgi:hypothetical protein